jgi:hypothetical protein
MIAPIDLKDDTIPQFKPLYNLTQLEMEALKQYNQENLQKWFVCPSCSLAVAPVFFVPRQDGLN